jgi:hypothetical protein
MEQIMADQTRMDMLPVLGGPVQKSTFEAPMASFATLMQRQASAQRSERDELRRLREELKEKNRLRGGCEQRTNVARARMQREHRREVDTCMHHLEKEKSVRAALQKRYEEHDRQLTQHEKEQMASRNVVEQVRPKREADEAMHMVAGLRELNEAIDGILLAEVAIRHVVLELGGHGDGPIIRYHDPRSPMI